MNKFIKYLGIITLLALAFFAAYISYQKLMSPKIQNDLIGTYFYHDPNKDICIMTLEKGEEPDVVVAKFTYYTIDHSTLQLQEAFDSEFVANGNTIYLHDDCDDHHEEGDLLPLASYEFKNENLTLLFFQTNKLFKKIDNKIWTESEINHFIESQI